MATPEKPECPRCGAAMEVGFVMDHSSFDVPVIPVWLEGEPVKDFWTGLNMDGKRMYKVLTHRCVKCGRLESFTGERHT